MSGWTEKDLADHMAKFPPRQIGSVNPESFTATHGTPKRQKFNAQPTVTRGRKFDSGKEARRYEELLLRLKAGEIRRLECQPVYVMHTENAEGEWIACGKFTPDFRYQEFSKRLPTDILPECWAERVEDVKGGKATRTEAYQLRKRHVEAEYGIAIIEV